jgi:hypothetical protein
MSGMKLPSSASSWLPARVTPLLAITAVVWLSAVLASMSALYGLATDYGGWGSHVAVLFPCCLDLYWIAALGVALDRSLPRRSRVAAAGHSAAAFALSAGGQLLYHELHAKEIHLGHLAPLAVGIIAIIPAAAGAALAHLVTLHQAATVPAAGAKAKRTAPAAAKATVPPGRATDARHRATATVPPTVPAVPDRAGQAAAATVPAVTVPAVTVPAELKPGGRPDPVAIEAAREEWHAAVKAGRIHNDRSLERAVNDRYGYKVIGRTSAGSVIAEESDARRRLA